MRSGPLSFLAAAPLTGAGVLAWTAWSGGPPAGEPIPLRASDVTVVDGDTVRVEGVLGGDRVRLMGHDTPEVFDPDCAREEELSRFAAASLQGMLGGRGGSS